MRKIPLLFTLIGHNFGKTIFLGAVLIFLGPCAIAAGVFEVTGDLNVARDLHTATLLPNDTVLVAGGEQASPSVGFFVLTSAEIYDSALGSWTTTGSLNVARFRHTATLLPNGNVLVVGGEDSSQIPLASTELYDPTSGTWTATGNLATARAFHTATLLLSGKVLVAGGFSGSGAFASAELYDPELGSWSSTGSLNTARDFHTATLLPNGMVLVAGGFDTNAVPIVSAELYDPASGTWSTTGDLNVARTVHTATLLPNGTVLVAGGESDTVYNALASAELYDPALGTWTTTGSLTTARLRHTATLLPDGTVLVAGGFAESVTNALASAELYDPATGTWSDTGSLITARYLHSATLLPNGTVVVPGGNNGFNSFASTELFDPGAPVITSPLTATNTINLPFVYQFEASGATTLDVTETDLPPGLAFDSALSAIVGQPEGAGTFQVGLSASNASGTTSATLNLTIQPTPTSGPTIISGTSVTGRTGLPFSFQVLTSGATSQARLTATGLPPGLSVDSVSGLISGIVIVDGSFAVTLTVTDGTQSATAVLELTFSSDLALPVIISPNVVHLVSGQPFSYTIDAPSADISDPISYQLTGILPPGLTFDPGTGTISGTFLGFSSDRPGPLLSGGVVSNVQLFATNSHGTGTTPLLFLVDPSGAVNISTRLDVGTGDDVLIGGFIITGNAPKKVIIRAIGPSLPVAGKLADPILELHDNTSLLGSNDNWRDTQEQEIIDSTVPPADPLESAIVATLAPMDPMVPGSGAYTVIVSGKNNGTGVALVEVYDLNTASFDISSEAKLANISTRGKVLTADNVMIGGFIVGGSTASNILVRAIGPELTAQGVDGALQDTTLDLYDGTGNLLSSNDDWESDQKQEIIDTTIPPTDSRESAIVATLDPGNYTAIVRGKNYTTGVALVEAYVLP